MNVYVSIYKYLNVDINLNKDYVYKRKKKIYLEKMFEKINFMILGSEGLC